jgi:hypothetical protein
MVFDRQETGPGRVDAFGDLVTKGVRNSLDLPAYHSFSEERYRFIENGSRIQDPDADSTRFTDRDKDFLLTPQAGDVLQFKTAERPRYIVGNDVAVSWAFKVEEDLQDADDSLTLFVEDAMELEYLGDDSITLRTIEGGVEAQTRSVDLPTDRTNPTRPELRFNWYAVGRLEVEIDYTVDDDQRTTDTVVLTDDDEWLSDNPTQRIGWELDVTNAGVEVACGSMAYQPQTDTPPTARNKPFALASSELGTIAASGYTAIGALRLDPNRNDVFTTITSVDVTAEDAVDVEVFLKAVPPSTTDADFLDPDDDGTDEGPAYPRQSSPQNSVVQWTPNVSTFPTRTYPVDGSTIPNGRLVGISTENSSGQGANATRTGVQRSANRPVYPDDVVIIIGHTPDESTSTDVDILIGTDQDW